MRECSFISVLIPLIGYKDASKTIESVVIQEYENCEILVLRNGLDEGQNLPEIWEKLSFYSHTDVLVREIFI